MKRRGLAERTNGVERVSTTASGKTLVIPALIRASTCSRNDVLFQRVEAARLGKPRPASNRRGRDGLEASELARGEIEAWSSLTGRVSVISFW
jgi:hypothetical protein